MTLKPPGPHMEASARVKAICDMAAGVSVNPDTHPKHYLRSGRELIRTAACYQEDGQTEHAYILYVRFLTIFLEKLRLHPNYKDVPLSERKVMMDYCNKILPQAEFLKNDLLKKYEKEHEEYCAQVEKLRQQAEEQRQREVEEKKRQDEEIAKNRNARNLPQPSRTSGDTSASGGSHKAIQPSSMGYAPSAPLDFPTELLPQNDLDATANLPSVQPQSKDPPAWLYDPTPVEKIRDPVGATHGGTNIPAGSIGIPSVDRSTKPSRVMTPMSSGLRPLVIPASLPETFLRYAESNTAKNVETCGLLTGKISGSRLMITDLIIPKQTGSSDTCTMLNETEIFNLQDKYNLISFGWIHTHPSQTAFLSSIDMHTHYSYQVMMPEAIAIVCAPKQNQTGVFTLTPYEGMQEIGSCTQSGFHPHKPNGLFCEASHCSLDSSMQVRIHDLR